MIRRKPRTEPRMDIRQFSGFRRPKPKPRMEPRMKLSWELQASPSQKPLHSHGAKDQVEIVEIVSEKSWVIYQLADKNDE